jgi:hypothetical protein
MSRVARSARVASRQRVETLMVQLQAKQLVQPKQVNYI